MLPDEPRDLGAPREFVDMKFVAHTATVVKNTDLQSTQCPLWRCVDFVTAMGRPYFYSAAIIMGGAAGWYCAQAHQLLINARSAKPVLAKAPVELWDVRVSQFASLSSGELKSQLEALLVSPVRDSEKLQALMFRWVVTDLESAKAWVRVWPDDKSKWADSSSQPVRDFFKAWAGIDPAAAMAEALAIGGEKTITAQDAVITGLARADFQTIKDVLSNTPDGKNNPRNAVAELMKQLVARDRTAALELAMSLKGAMGDGAVAGISEVWARTDPKSALAWAEQHPEAAIRDNATKIILMQCARQDPESVGPMLIQKKEGLPDVFRTEVADEAVARLSESSPQEAAAFVAKYYPQDRLKANLGSLFFRLMDEGAGNPRAAAAMCACVNLLPEEVLKDTKLWGNSWMSDLKPSWERMWAEPESPGRQFLLGEIGRKFSTQNPTQTINDIMNVEDPADRVELFRASFRGDFQSYFADEKQLKVLRQAVETMPESVRSVGAAELAWATAAQDPMGAAEVIRQYPAVAETSNLIENIAIRMVGKVDLGAAQTWADSLPTPEALGRGYSGIVSGHYSEDSEATSRWVQTLPPGPGRDAAASALANSAKEDDPEAAFAWARSIQDGNQRTASTELVVKSWAAADQTAAMAALEQSNLPLEQKDALMKTLLGPQ